MLFLCASSSAVGATLLYGMGGELEEVSRVCACHVASLFTAGDLGSCAVDANRQVSARTAPRPDLRHVALAAPPRSFAAVVEEAPNANSGLRLQRVQNEQTILRPSALKHLIATNPDVEIRWRRNEVVRREPLPHTNTDPKGEKEVMDELLELFPGADMPSPGTKGAFVKSARVQYAMCRGVAGLSQETCLSRTKRLIRSTFHLTLLDGRRGTGFLVYEDRDGERHHSVATVAHLGRGISNAEFRGTMTNGSVTLSFDRITLEAVPALCDFVTTAECANRVKHQSEKDVGRIPVDFPLPDAVKLAAWPVDGFPAGLEPGSDALLYGNAGGQPTTVVGSLTDVKQTTFVENAENTGSAITGDRHRWKVPESLQRMFVPDPYMWEATLSGVSGGALVPFDLSAPLGLAFMGMPIFAATNSQGEPIAYGPPLVLMVRPKALNAQLKRLGDRLYGSPTPAPPP